MAENETYQVTAECSNCGRVPKRTTPEGKAIEPFEYKIPRGQIATEFLRAQACPNCGCKGYLKRQFS